MKFLTVINKYIKRLKKKSDLEKFKNILVVSNSGLGDTLLSTPAIKSLRMSFPEINITFLINRKMYPLFEGFEYVDDFVMYRSGFLSQCRVVYALKKKKIDTIFLFHSCGPEDVFFSILSGAENIFKMTDNVNHEYKDIFSNKANDKLQHDIEKKLDLVRYFKPSTIDTRMEMPRKFYALKTKKIKSKWKTLVGFQVGAQDIYKMWDINNFIQLADKMIGVYDCAIVLLGATDIEKQLTRKLIEEVTCPERIINMCGSSRIDELPSILNCLDFLVTNDTGTLHLAITLKVPTISLFGPTNSIEFGPYQDTDVHRVIQKDGFFVNDCPKKQRTQDGINLISVDEVYEQVVEFMR
jgi:ADP-heptose:LPS heptosyltransferase